MPETEGRNRRNTFIFPSRRLWRSGIHERRSQQTSPATGSVRATAGTPPRCPNCGSGPIFESWLRMRPRCPVCRLRLERGEEGLLLYGGAVLMVIAPFLFYPFSKTLFLAFDLIFRPPSPEDFK